MYLYTRDNKIIEIMIGVLILNIKKELILLIKGLSEHSKTLSCMESCTGGGLANQITNIDGASEVFKFSAVTYCNEYKVKMGVPEHIINMYGVYSIEVAREMAKAISKFSNSDYGIGVTGTLNCPDRENPSDSDNTVYISIYDKDNNISLDSNINVTSNYREDNKNIVIIKIVEMLRKYVKKNN